MFGVGAVVLIKLRNFQSISANISKTQIFGIILTMPIDIHLYSFELLPPDVWEMPQSLTCLSAKTWPKRHKWTQRGGKRTEQKQTKEGSEWAAIRHKTSHTLFREWVAALEIQKWDPAHQRLMLKDLPKPHKTVSFTVCLTLPHQNVPCGRADGPGTEALHESLHGGVNPPSYQPSLSHFGHWWHGGGW